jgi:glucose-1-phosphate adenylyltransferase
MIIGIKLFSAPQDFMSQTGRQSINVSNVLCVIMGGGQGTRLFPLTKDRAKPAVPLAGKYRLVDIPISNCINSGFRPW